MTDFTIISHLCYQVREDGAESRKSLLLDPLWAWFFSLRRLLVGPFGSCSPNVIGAVGPPEHVILVGLVAQFVGTLQGPEEQQMLEDYLVQQLRRADVTGDCMAIFGAPIREDYHPRETNNLAILSTSF